MIDVPKEVSNDVFDKEIKRGSILKTLFLCHDGREKPKYYIIVSSSKEADPLIFVISTSQLDFYNRNPRFNTEILRISVGLIDCFSLDTIIDCTRVYRMPRWKLKKNYQENILRFCGELSTGYLSQIDNIIKKSRLISNRNKKLILGTDYNKE